MHQKCMEWYIVWFYDFLKEVLTGNKFYWELFCFYCAGDFLFWFDLAWDRVLLCSFGWPWTSDALAWTSQVLGLQVCPQHPASVMGIEPGVEESAVESRRVVRDGFPLMMDCLGVSNKWNKIILK
jgi:hypothetical protein